MSAKLGKIGMQSVLDTFLPSTIKNISILLVQLLGFLHLPPKPNLYFLKEHYTSVMLFYLFDPLLVREIDS